MELFRPGFGLNHSCLISKSWPSISISISLSYVINPFPFFLHIDCPVQSCASLIGIRGGRPWMRARGEIRVPSLPFTLLLALPSLTLSPSGSSLPPSALVRPKNSNPGDGCPPNPNPAIPITSSAQCRFLLLRSLAQSAFGPPAAFER